MDSEEKLPQLSQKKGYNKQQMLQQQAIHRVCQDDQQQILYKYKNYPRQSSQSNQTQQILYWIILGILILGLVYLIYDNHCKEKDIISIMQQIERRAIEIKQLQNQQKQQKEESVGQFSQKQVVFLPQKAWYFRLLPINQSSLLTQKCFQAYQNKMHKIGFELTIINLQNYSLFIKSERYLIIEQQLRSLKRRYELGLQPEIIKYHDLIIKQLIIIEILIQNGGIYLEQDMILTEDLSWIHKIYTNKYINAKKWINQVELFAFYSPFLSPDMTKSNLIQTDIQTQKYIVETPTISSYFIAAIKDCSFLKDLRSEYHELLGIKSKYLKDKLQREELKANFAQKNIHFYKFLFQISSQITLQKKQKVIGTQNPVIIFYQIATINQNYGPQKLKAYLQQSQPKKIIMQLSSISREQLEYQFGRIRYMIKIEPIQQYRNLLLEKIRNKEIRDNSIINQEILQSRKRENNMDKAEIDEKNEKWLSLPSNIWTYCKQNQFNLFSKIWRKYNHFISIQSKYKFIILTQQNLHQYLSRQAIKQIQSAIKNKQNKLRIYQKSKMEMISLAVLYEHGGVWIDPQVFMVGNLQWLRNINQQPFLWNKNGPLPKVLLPFHPHYISPFQWKYNQNGLKQSWHLGYQRDFIAAQPETQLLKLWLSQYILNLQINFQQLKNKFYHCKIVSNMWIKENDHQFLAQDSLKCLLGTKKVQFINTRNSLCPTAYYGLWAINGFSGLYKMRENTDFLSTSRSMQNPLIWRKSFEQMQDIVGRVRYFTRIYFPSSSKMEQIIKSNINNLQKQFHKDSFFMKLLQKLNGTVTVKQGKLSLSKQLNLLK